MTTPSAPSVPERLAEPKGPIVLRVTAHDVETGEEQTLELPAGEYVVIATAPCHVSATQAYPTKGTHVVTIKCRVQP